MKEKIEAAESINARSGALVRGLGPLDATMIVVGSMIGSGIFITSAESAGLIGAPGWLLLAWAVAGLMTITGALCFAAAGLMQEFEHPAGPRRQRA